MAVYQALLLNTVVPQIQAAQAGDSYVMVVNATTPALRITQTGTGDSILVEDAANPDGSPFVVTAGGDVGIGTNSPDTKLTLAGNGHLLSLTNPSSAIANGIIRWKNSSGTTQAFIGSYVNIADTGNLEFGNASTTTMNLTASGNLGLGVTTLSPWNAGHTAMQIAFSGAIHGNDSGNNLLVNSNAYFDSVGAFRYIQTGFASSYEQNSGQHRWSTAPSGTAGNVFSFTQAMTLDASGNLIVGATSGGGAKITAVVANNASNQLGLSVTNQTNADFNAWIATNYTLIGPSSSTPLAFATGSTERARITSDGYFKASNNGTYNGVALTYHEFYNSADNAVLLIRAANATQSSDVFVALADRNTTNNSFYAINYYNSGAGAYKFRVADSGDVTNTNGTYGTISDAKMKTDIVDAGSQWADIKALRFRKFKMKDDPSGRVQLGVVAQEVELTSPGLVDEHTDRDAEGNDLGTTTKSVKTSVLLMKAAVALQEAMARIETLEAKIAALEAK